MTQDNNPYQSSLLDDDRDHHAGQRVLRFALYFFLFIVFLAMVPLVLAIGAFVGGLCYAFSNGL